VKVGILGGGQLARMLAECGAGLGIECRVLSPEPDACAAAFAGHLQAAYDDIAALDRLATWADVITYEFENVPLKAVAHLSERVPVHPGADALAVAQDRLREKSCFRALDIPTPAFAAVDDPSDLPAAASTVGLPAILKTRTQGYDGKGQAAVSRSDELEEAWRRTGEVPAILEARVRFRREVSIIAVRGVDGAKVYYPLSENTHREGILRLSLSRDGDPLQARAQALIDRLLDHLDYVGVLALELFDCGERLLANEIAPRVHNSGHWTIEGASTSQFENHLRAITGTPLGPTGLRRPAAMINLIGHRPRGLAEALPDGATLHDYGKAERAGRKIGHVTLLGDERHGSVPADALARCLDLTGERDLARQARASSLAMPSPASAITAT